MLNCLLVGFWFPIGFQDEIEVVFRVFGYAVVLVLVVVLRVDCSFILY